MNWLIKFLKDLFQKPDGRIIENKNPEPIPKPVDPIPTTETKETVPVPVIEKKFRFEADPLDYLTCTQKFGERPEFYAQYGSPKGHNGMDLRTWVNGNSNNWKTNVYAVMSGNVLESREDNIKGKYVRLGHGDRGQTVYLHLSSLSVNEGGSVKAGQLLGLSGNSGVASEAPHLHFGYRPKGFNKNDGKMGYEDQSEFFVGNVTYV